MITTEPADNRPITWCEFFDRYSCDAFPRLSPTSRKDSRNVAADVDWLLHPVSLDELPDRLDEFDALLAEMGNGPESRRNKLGRLRAMIDWAVRQRFLLPTAGEQPPARRTGLPAADCDWREFRAAYEREVAAGFAGRTQDGIGQILNELERIASPSRPADFTPQRLSDYQAQLRDGGVAATTVKKKLGHVKAILRWAFRMGYIASPPQIDIPRRSRGQKMMKGRPISEDEFSRMLAATVEIVGRARAPSWRHYLRGLWASGLRLGESLALVWTGDVGIRVDRSGPHITLRIPGEYQKSGRDQEALPIVPEFEQFLLATPEDRRHGYVFNPKPQRVVLERLTSWLASRTIGAIGEAAGVIVGKQRGGKPKYASAHDFRRSVLTRWAYRVPALVLQEIARHSSLTTTKQFYLGVDAQRTASLLWDAHAAAAAGKPPGGV